MNDIDLLDHLNDYASDLIFHKPYKCLEIAEISTVSKYIYDFTHPEFRRLIIAGSNKDPGYLISNTGIIVDKNFKEVKSYTNSGGYKTCWLRGFNENMKNLTPVLIHRAVAQAFIPNPENKEEINHKNCDKTFNWVGNLEWVTHMENIQYSDKLGHRVYGTKHKKSKCTESQIRQVCEMLEKDSLSMNDISRITKVPLRTITHIRFDGGWPQIAKDYNFPKDKRKQGPRFSPISTMILNAVQEGKSNNEIITELRKSELSIGISDKSIQDRIYHIRKISQ